MRTLSQFGCGWCLHRFEIVHVQFRSSDRRTVGLSQNEINRGRAPASNTKSRNRLQSPLMFPRHQQAACAQGKVT